MQVSTSEGLVLQKKTVQRSSNAWLGGEGLALQLQEVPDSAISDFHLPGKDTSGPFPMGRRKLDA